MANDNGKIPYDQIPHVLLSHPQITGDHIFIFVRLYKILKSKPYCIYSNKKLSIECRLPERTIYRRLDELENFGFIKRIGQSYNRKFYLGHIFDTSAKYDVTKLNTSATMAQTSAKIAGDPCHGGIYIKNSIKNNIKKYFSSLSSLYQEYISKIKCEKELGIKTEDFVAMDFEQWKEKYHPDIV